MNDGKLALLICLVLFIAFAAWFLFKTPEGYSDNSESVEEDVVETSSFLYPNDWKCVGDVFMQVIPMRGVIADDRVLFDERYAEYIEGFCFNGAVVFIAYDEVPTDKIEISIE